ncbi:SDR family NAD(P)-dependent oxidoreductase [Kibdelosporangium aridum]|uniref:SDR family NAD(P)-dependent oxidoreductase n=1 Tax=Kibdelosporangium aridum TaxID=2030 RepID=UPI001F2BA8E2|nr:SDR family NAD(P)-dependent oxidoreductase [Kibdelosporangium aridum]
MDGFLPPVEVVDATWDRVFGVNLTGPMRLTRAILPGMIAAGGGAIMNVASAAALRASPSGAAYTASKHAIVGYTKRRVLLQPTRHSRERGSRSSIRSALPWTMRGCASELFAAGPAARPPRCCCIQCQHGRSDRWNTACHAHRDQREIPRSSTT